MYKWIKPVSSRGFLIGQGKKREKQVKLQGNEHIRGLISHKFTFSKRGILGTLTLGGNRWQVKSFSAF